MPPGTCGLDVGSPDLAAWAAHPAFAPDTPDPSPFVDVAAHGTAFGLASSGDVADVTPPCPPSFQGGAGDAVYEGLCVGPSGIVSSSGWIPCVPPHIEGGGCAHAPTSGLLTVAIAVLVVLRRRLRAGTVLGVLAAVLLGSPAEAADVVMPISLEPGATRLVHPTPDYVPWTVHTRIDAAWRGRVIRAVYADGSDAPLLSHLGTGTVSVGLDLFRFARFTVALPMHGALAGDADGIDGSLIPRKFVPGDVSLQLAGAILRGAAGRSALQVVARFDLPLAPAAPWVAGPSFSADVTYRQTLGPIALSGQAGVLTMRNGAPTALTGAAAVTGTWRWLQITGEIAAQAAFHKSTDIEEKSLNDPVETIVAGPWSPAIANGGLGFRLSRGVWLRASGGLGLDRALGAPRWETALTLDVSGHEPEDLDHDGLINVRDRCPRRPEDVDHYADGDGCPDPDNDEDGLLDPVDLCPDVPEDLDGDADDDGCPDHRVDLVVTVESEDPGVAEATTIVIDGFVVGSLVDALTLTVPLTPGAHRLDVHATGHATWSELVQAPALGDATEDVTIRVTATPELLRFGGLAVQLTDVAGIAVEGWLRVDQRAEVVVPAAGWSAEIPTGRRRLTAGAPGFAPRTVGVDVRRDEDTTAVIALDRAVAWVDDDAVRLARVLRFPLDGAQPEPEDVPLLDALADLLRQHPEIVLLRVEGHADSPGSSRYNYQLSLDRADAVVRALVERGIDAERLIAVGAGEATRETGPVGAVRTVDFLVVVWDAPATAPTVP